MVMVPDFVAVPLVNVYAPVGVYCGVELPPPGGAPGSPDVEGLADADSLADAVLLGVSAAFAVLYAANAIPATTAVVKPPIRVLFPSVPLSGISSPSLFSAVRGAPPERRARGFHRALSMR